MGYRVWETGRASADVSMTRCEVVSDMVAGSLVRCETLVAAPVVTR